MDPVHTYFNELEIYKDNTFTTNTSQENEVENVLFNTDKEYAVTGMIIKPDIVDSELVKIENTKELDRISIEIQELVKSYKDPDLRPAFSKKMRIWPTKNKTILFQYNYKQLQLQQNFLVYDYYQNLKKFGFTWEHKILGIKYGIRISNPGNRKIKKQLTMRSDTRKKLCLDSSRVWNMSNAWPANKAIKFRYSYLIGYLEGRRVMESMLGITESSFYFKSMSIPTKMDIEEDIRDISIEVHMTHPYRNFFFII